MITKMSKYTFILLSSELNDFLAQLQEVGIVDITRSTVETDSVSKDMMNLYKRYNQIISKLETFKKENESIKPADVNLTGEDKEVNVVLTEAMKKQVQITSFMADSLSAENTFDNPDRVVPKASCMEVIDNQLTYTFPAHSVTVLAYS